MTDTHATDRVPDAPVPDAPMPAVPVPDASMLQEMLQTPGPDDPRMTTAQRWFVGSGTLVAGVFGLVALVGAYGLTEELVVAQEGSGAGTLARQAITVGNLGFSLTLTMSLLLVGAAGGFVGSIVQQAIVFASRAGLGTLESGYVWWYVLRPVWSALLGSVIVIAINAGLISIGDQTTSAAGVTILASAAAVAGLYTDKALQRLQSVLGATDPSELGSEQVVPGVGAKGQRAP